MSFANDNPGAMAYPDAPGRDNSDCTLSVEEASNLFLIIRDTQPASG
jgi:hypothetical protein